MYKSCILIIFIRNLVKGKVKTRLAKEIGVSKAYETYKKLLFHTQTITNKLELSKSLYYSEEIDIDTNWGNCIFKKQAGNDLGERMQNAFEESFVAHQKAVIIGSDCYELTSVIISKAFKQLNQYDAVVGPAKDGGFYLLGLRQHLPKLFENKVYSTSTVFDEIIDELKKMKLSVAILPTLRDIDTLEDLKASSLDIKLY